MKRQILDAYGVTEEETDAVDRALGGPALRTRRHEAERQVAQDADDLAEDLSALLPAGLRVEWSPLTRR